AAWSASDPRGEAAEKQREVDMSESSAVTEPQDVVARGRCVCGGVRFEVCGPLRSVIYCHCTLCRRFSGHFVAATACASEHLRLVCAGTLRWYRSSAIARRGFCGTCGSQLFWEPGHGDHISIWAGSLDAPTGLTAAKHIFVADKGDYYQIQDGLPQQPA
ncbi:MAG TPA: GFA family protein, partial [Steroidobacteraceae bacterium]|nr:GFA family protein [Steroidobacteraceae bacterium]